MKKLLLTILLFSLLLSGCGNTDTPSARIAATTLPVWELTTLLCEGTGLTVARLVTEPVSCLHDYALNVRQVQTVEAAELVVISGAGLEDFMEDVIVDKPCIDASENIPLLCGTSHDHDHDHGHHDHGHSHGEDPHIWLSPENGIIMAENICAGLQAQYPDQAHVFQANLETVTDTLLSLQRHGRETLSDLGCRELITFHDGFAYFAQAFDLTILKAVEEESGSEASAADLKELITLVRAHQLPAVFTESMGSVSAAETICAQTGAKCYELNMGMHGNSYLDALRHNIDTLKEALQ